MKVQVTGGAVVSLIGLAVIGAGVFYARGALAGVVNAPVEAAKAIGKAAAAVNNAVPPGLSVKRPDGTTATVSGEDIKKYNANGANMGFGTGGWGFSYLDKKNQDYGYIQNFDPNILNKLAFSSLSLEELALPENSKPWSMFGG